MSICEHGVESDEQACPNCATEQTVLSVQHAANSDASSTIDESVEDGAQLDTQSPVPHRRRGLLVGVAVLVVALVVGMLAVVATGGNSDASAAVIKAATISGNAKTADVTYIMSMKISAKGQTATIMNVNGSGSMDVPNHAVDLTMQMNSSMGAGTGASASIHEILYQGSIFMQGGPLSSSLPSGKSWLGIKTPSVASASTTGGLQDPGSTFQSLEASGATVSDQGTVSVNGAPCESYSVAVTKQTVLARAAKVHLSPEELKAISSLFSTSNTLTYLVAIGKTDGYIHQIVLGMPMAILGSHLTMSITMNFSNFGSAVSITPPPADQVYFITNPN